MDFSFVSDKLFPQIAIYSSSSVIAYSTEYYLRRSKKPGAGCKVCTATHDNSKDWSRAY